MPRTAVLGAGGQLGRELELSLKARGHEVTALARADLDITDRAALEARLAELAPDAVFNASAYTNVDGAEDDRDRALEVNAHAPGHLASLCARQDIALFHISTDYVFDGRGPHAEDAPTGPSCVYGETKLMGEQLVLRAHGRALVFRVSWLFGRFGRNFAKTMLRLGRDRDEVSVVDDQVGSPTPARALAESLTLALDRVMEPDFGEYGIYHYSGRPYCSWAGFAQEIFACAGRGGMLDHEVRVQKIPSSQFKTKATRPSDSRLDCSRFERVFGQALPDWHAYIEETLRAADGK